MHPLLYLVESDSNLSWLVILSGDIVPETFARHCSELPSKIIGVSETLAPRRRSHPDTAKLLGDARRLVLISHGSVILTFAQVVMACRFLSVKLEKKFVVDLTPAGGRYETC